MTRTEEDLLKQMDNSPSAALELAKNLIQWLEWVADSGYEESDRQRVIMACHKFCTTIQPIATKYMD